MSVQMRSFLTAQWRYLVMLNYEVEPESLMPYLPRGTELDSWNGQFYISLVGFHFAHTRVMGLPIPGCTSFEEVNLRFYVRRHAVDGWRRGVVFIKEIVPRRLIACVAKNLFNEPYVAMPMRHTIQKTALDRSEDGAIEYGWFHRGQWNELKAVTLGKALPLIEGSEEEFITEHYWGYTAQPNGGCKEYRVDHIPWRVWKTRTAKLLGEMAVLYGEEFARIMRLPPSSAFVADGSAVKVGWGRTIS